MAAESEARAPERELGLADLEAAVLAGLGEHFPGLEIVDRTLEITVGASAGAEAAGVTGVTGVTGVAGVADRALRADLVAVDAGGRIVLIALVDGSADETALLALEWLALVRSHRRLLGSQLRSRRAARLRTDVPALIVLIAESFAARIQRALSGVSPRELLLFEVRELSSAGGRSSAFVPLNAGPDLALSLERLPPSLRATAEQCLAQVDRIDSDLERRAGFDAVAWRFERRSLCSVAWVGDELVGVVAADGGVFHLRRAEDVDPFVDRVLWAHLAELARGEPAPSDRPWPGSEAGQSGSLDASPGVLLTAEELAAFRD